MKPTTKTQQKNIAKLIQTIQEKARQFNNPIGSIISSSIVNTILAMLANSLPPFIWLSENVLFTPFRYLLNPIIESDFNRLYHQQLNYFIKHYEQASLQNLREISHLLSATELSELKQTILEQGTDLFYSNINTEELRHKMSSTGDSLAMYLSYFTMIAVSTLFIHHYLIQPTINRRYSFGIFTDQQPTDHIKFLHEEAADDLIRKLETVNDDLDSQVWYLKLIARLIALSSFSWFLYASMASEGFIFLPILIAITDFATSTYSPTAILGRACFSTAFSSMRDDVSQFSNSLSLNKRIAQLEQQFNTLASELKIDSCQAKQTNIFESSYVELSITRTYGSSRKRSARTTGFSFEKS